MEELEDIATAAAGACTYSTSATSSQQNDDTTTQEKSKNMFKGWTVNCTFAMGVRYFDLTDCLMGILEKWNAKVPEKHTHLLDSITYAILKWKEDATRYRKVDWLYDVVLCHMLYGSTSHCIVSYRIVLYISYSDVV